MDNITKALLGLIKEVQETSDYSEVLGPPNEAESLSDLNLRLLTVRSRQTRLTEIVGQLVRINSVARKSVIDAEGELLDAEAKVVSNTKKGFVEDFSSAQERNAKLASQTLEQRIEVRKAKKVSEDSYSALEYAKLRHRELGNQVQDVNTRLRIVTLEGNWD